MALRFLVAAGLVAAMPAPPARPDPEELRARLAAAEVDPKLRQPIQEAIERGSAYLRDRQSAEGWWGPTANLDSESGNLQVLCALALRHAGGPENEAAVGRALPGLVASIGAGPASCTARGLGLLALLLAFDPDSLPHLRAITRRMQRPGASDAGWWDHLEGGGTPSLTASHFVVLGLWAAGRRDPAEDPDESRALRRHLEALLALQAPEGWYPARPGEDPSRAKGRWYTTFMGHANLLLCKAALAGARAADPALEARVAEAEGRGLRALIAHGQEALRKPEVAAGEPETGAWVPYDRLCMLELACVLAGVERLGPVPWYATGARFLLRNQRYDGSWGYAVRNRLPAHTYKAEGDARSTALALLFLVRWAEAYRPGTPRPVDAPRPAPGGEPPDSG